MRVIAAVLAATLLAAAPARAEVPVGNLVANPGAEAAPGAADLEIVPVPNWAVESNFTAVQYGADGFPTAGDSAAFGGGANFFAGGPSTAVSAATQVVDVGMAAAEIDARRVTATLAALLGGYDGQEDSATVTATMLSAAGASLGSATLPAVTMAERRSVTTLISRSVTAPVPAGTRRISVRLAATRTAGDYNDGYVDNVSLTLAAGAGPVFHKTVVVEPVSGTVLVRRPGSKRFVRLSGASDIPLGSEVNTKRGVVRLTSVPRAGGTPESARFFDGIFVVRQPGAITELTLSERLARCGRARAAAVKKRRLWGDGRGSFRTTGRYSAATVRGTRWLVQDTCAGTLTRVTQGSVRVRDKVRRRTVIVRAGRRYLARPRR